MTRLFLERKLAEYQNLKAEIELLKSEPSKEAVGNERS